MIAFNSTIRLSVILLLFTFFSCKTSHKVITQNPTKSLIIKQLIADDFSENFTRLSTQNDEIILLLSFYEKENSKALSHKTYGTFLFDKNHTVQMLNDSILLKCDYFIATLIELDTEKTAQEIAEDVFSIYEDISHPDIEQAIHKTTLELAIGDDDFLDVKYIDTATLKKQHEITFWGIHLFDEYQYRLLIEVF